MASQFNIAEIFRTPTDREFENEINTMQERQAALGSDREDGEIDEDDDDSDDGEGLEKSLDKEESQQIRAIQSLKVQQAPINNATRPATLSESPSDYA